jgi:hypothetical protein
MAIVRPYWGLEIDFLGAEDILLGNSEVWMWIFKLLEQSSILKSSHLDMASGTCPG